MMLIKLITVNKDKCIIYSIFISGDTMHASLLQVFSHSKKGGKRTKCNFFAATLTNFNSLIKMQLRTITAMNKEFQFVDFHILHITQTHRSTLGNE